MDEKKPVFEINLNPGDAGFQIDTAEKAAWAVGKRNAIEAKARLLKAQYDAMRDDIENDLRSWDSFFGEKLKIFAQSNLPHGKKSLKLLTGTVGFRSLPEKIEVRDETSVLRWASQNLPAAVIVKESLSLTELKKHMKATGEIPEGVSIVPSEERFYVSDEQISKREAR